MANLTQGVIFISFEQSELYNNKERETKWDIKDEDMRELTIENCDLPFDCLVE